MESGDDGFRHDDYLEDFTSMWERSTRKDMPTEGMATRLFKHPDQRFTLFLVVNKKQG